MFKKKKIVNESKIDTLIGNQVSIEGNITLDGGYTQINGHLKGNVTSHIEHETTLIINHNALVEGDIAASFIFIQGELKGNLHAHKKVTLMDKALVNGDVRYESIEMQLGAKVNGRFICQVQSQSNQETAVKNFSAKASKKSTTNKTRELTLDDDLMAENT